MSQQPAPSWYTTQGLCRELSRRMGYQIGRDALYRIRTGYPDRAPEPHRVGIACVWMPDAVEAFHVLFAERDRCLPLPA